METVLCKSIGAVVLLVSSLIYGRQKIHAERRRLGLTEAMCEFVGEIGDSIEHRMRPLPDIFRSYRNQALEECGFLPAVRENGLRNAWDACAPCFRELDGRIFERMSAFCDEIGRGYREEELELCSLTIKQLRDECARLKNDSKNKEKLYRTIPPLMAMSAVLVLL